VHAFAIPLLGLEGSLDSSPPGGVQKPVRTAVVYKRQAATIVIPVVSLIRQTICLAMSTGPCYTSRPEAAGVVARVATQYELHQTLRLTLHKTIQ
jgi:hypothetical protein